ncbi:MAG: metallophosphoesterase family protein [Opitutaceae bacterium]|nr:metallophosphoesterase family protein [Cytophagales bacterium]
MKYIGLISDTHGFLDPKVFQYFEQCDEIWHAGDVGSEDILDKLKLFKPLKAVYGNIDGGVVRQMLPEDLVFDCEGMKVYMTHIGGSPGKYNARVKTTIHEVNPAIFICGHSHILKVISDPIYKPLLYLNPGAAGIHGFHHVRTLLRFKIDQGKLFDMQVIELGKRSMIM